MYYTHARTRDALDALVFILVLVLYLRVVHGFVHGGVRAHRFGEIVVVGAVRVGFESGFAALDAVDSVRVRHRKGVPVICVKEPGRKLFLELAPESDLSAATWASTLCHLVRLARESSAFS